MQQPHTEKVSYVAPTPKSGTKIIAMGLYTRLYDLRLMLRFSCPRLESFGVRNSNFQSKQVGNVWP